MYKKLPIETKKLLQGRYEAENLPKDFSEASPVPGFAYNILNQMGLLYRPVLDEAYLSEGGKRPVWPDGKTFAVCLSHDVDEVSALSVWQTLRRRYLKFLLVPSGKERLKNIFGGGFEVLQNCFGKIKNDPYHCFERWLQVEEKHGAKSTFFFWPGFKAVNRHHVSDCVYELYDSVYFDGQACSVAEMMQEIDNRGWEIGLHPSWYAFNNLDELKRQKETVEKVVGHDIVSVRHHMLHYDIRITPRIDAEAGFKFDSTLGFNDNLGFRFGTCYPWYLYDLKKDEDLQIMEIPIIVQDGAMLKENKGLRLDPEKAFQYVEMFTNQVKNVGGVLTLLWHPNYIPDPDYWELYLEVLEYLQQHNAWFASVREIGEFWQQQQAS